MDSVPQSVAQNRDDATWILTIGETNIISGMPLCQLHKIETMPHGFRQLEIPYHMGSASSEVAQIVFCYWREQISLMTSRDQL